MYVSSLPEFSTKLIFLATFFAVKSCTPTANPLPKLVSLVGSKYLRNSSFEHSGLLSTFNSCIWFTNFFVNVSIWLVTFLSLSMSSEFGPVKWLSGLPVLTWSNSDLVLLTAIVPPNSLTIL